MALEHTLTPEGYSKAIPCTVPTDAFGVVTDPTICEIDGEFGSKKETMAACPASLFSGKLRFLVQAIYGSDRTDLAVETSAAGTYRPIIDGVTLHYGYSNSHGLYTDDAGEYWLIYMTSNGANIRRLTKNCLADELDLNELKEEAFILAGLSFDEDEYSVGVLGTAPKDYGSPIDYGWHFTWDGDEASCVLIRQHPDWEGPPSLANSWWQSSLWTVNLVDNDSDGSDEADYDTLEDYITARFRIQYTMSGSLVDFSMHASDLIWSRTPDDGLMSIEDYGWSCACLPYPCAGHDAEDAPLYCIYDENDELRVVTYSKTTLASTEVTTSGGNITQSQTSKCGCDDGCWWQHKKSGAKSTRSLTVEGLTDYNVEANATLKIAATSWKPFIQDESYPDPCTYNTWRPGSTADGLICGGSVPPQCGGSPPRMWYVGPIMYPRRVGYGGTGYDTAALILIVPWGDCSAFYVGSDQYRWFDSNAFNVSISGVNCTTGSNCNPANYCEEFRASHYTYSGALCNCTGACAADTPINCCDMVPSPAAGYCWPIAAAYDACFHNWASAYSGGCDEESSIIGPTPHQMTMVNYSTQETIPGYPEAYYWTTIVDLIHLRGVTSILNATGSGGEMMDPDRANLMDCGSPEGSDGYTYGASRWPNSWNKFFAPGTAVCLGDMPVGSRMEVWQSVGGAIQYIKHPDYTDEVEGYDTVDWYSRFVGWS